MVGGLALFVAVVALVVARPGLLFSMITGVILGALTALALRALAGRGKAGQSNASSEALSKRGIVVAVSLMFASVGASVALLAAVVNSPHHIAPGVGRVVAPVYYAANVEFSNDRDAATRRQTVRIPRRLVRGRARGRERALLPGWRYLGVRGPQQELLLYARTDAIPNRTGFWPQHQNSADIPVESSDLLPIDLSPMQGSTITLRAPRRRIGDTDPSGTRRTFGSTDIITIELDEEDEPEFSQIHYQVANWAGRTSIFAGLRTVSAWSIVKWLISLLAASAVAFFLDRAFKKRWPDPAARSAAAAAST